MDILNQILLTLLTSIALLMLRKILICREHVYYQYSFTLIQNSKALAKIWTLNAGRSKLIPKKNRLKFLTLHLSFCLLSHKLTSPYLSSSDPVVHKAARLPLQRIRSPAIGFASLQSRHLFFFFFFSFFFHSSPPSFSRASHFPPAFWTHDSAIIQLQFSSSS